MLDDLGYEDETDTITVAVNKPQDAELTDEQQTHNKTHNKAHHGKRAVGERGNSLLKTTFPERLNVIAAASSWAYALVDRRYTDGAKKKVSLRTNRPSSSSWKKSAKRTETVEPLRSLPLNWPLTATRG